MILPSIQATEALRITGAELQKLEVVDEVIPVWLNLYFLHFLGLLFSFAFVHNLSMNAGCVCFWLWESISTSAVPWAVCEKVFSMHLKSFDECVLQEPLGGAHSDPVQTSKNIKAVIMKHMHVSDFRYISSSTVAIRLYSLDSYQYYISLS